MKSGHIRTMYELSVEDINEIIDTGIRIKKEHKEGKQPLYLQGKTLAMIFQKPSTRTRVSFETGIFQLGGVGLYLGPNDLQLNRGETISDTAKVLSRYVDVIMARVFSHDDIEGLASNATVPVINGLSDLSHPCQVLADLQTIKEHKGTLKGLKLAYIGDGNNMAHSLMNGCAKVGMHFAMAHPAGYEPDSKQLEQAQSTAKETGCEVLITKDAREACTGADVIYTDVWTSMGQEEEKKKRLNDFAGFQVNSDLVKVAKKDYIFMHCLPAHRGEEVSAEILDGPNSVIFDEAENRMHTQKAIMVLLAKGN